MKSRMPDEESSQELRILRVKILNRLCVGEASDDDKRLLRQVEWELHRRWQQNPNLYYNLEND